ncbi:MAG: porin family protein [Methylococcales bacterium]|nr:porin family protein [Methylococcales bacterium]MDP3839387.1 porin family protein [Methylococcales bacterium]
MTFKKTKLVLSIATVALTMGAALVSPQAMAHKAKKSHHHTSAQPSYSKVDALESQVRMMQEQIAALTAAQTTAAPVAAVDTAKVEELDQWMASVKAAPVIEKTKDNMMFFRGGYAHANATRGGTLDPTTVGTAGNRNGLLNGPITDKDAWYMGAGFDFSLNNNLFGLMDDTEVLAELMFDYKELGTRGFNGISGNVANAVNIAGLGISANTQRATVNQFTLAASPKIKFMKGSSFRPWIIPVGFEINVISPPSDAITVLNPGMQFGLGADYKIWKDIYIGADARYHQTLNSSDGVRTNGLTAGGYLGLGF